ncbi:MAG: hypothetical protein J6N15_00220 [Ruminiclostridium sp.]|nr:hypothetical protein [Ruminiclostridium sp.]
MIVEWAKGVSSRFFGLQEKPKDNAVKSEFISGRTTVMQINTRNVIAITCSLRLSVRDGELARFWKWFNDELGGVSGTFKCAALGDKSYRFVEVPEPQDTGRTWRTLAMSIEEDY